MADNSAPPDLIGHRLFGTYTITEKLGEGAMGNVYLAKQGETGQRIAIKLLNAEAAAHEETVARFLREARVISMITHPNVVRVFIFGETSSGISYMAMEHVDGVPLDRVVRGKALGEERSIHIARQILSAIGEAHDLGIMHRDLKPENVLLTTWRGEPDYVKILDFGIAKVQNTNQQLTQAGIVYGTPAYMSPEQAQALEVDARSDIYALGCMLYEMTTGQLPFEARSSLKILEMQAFQEPRPPREIGTLSAGLEHIILRSMAKNAENRYQTAQQMLDALDALTDKPPATVTADVPAAPEPASDDIPVTFQMLNDLALNKPWFWPAAILLVIGSIGMAFFMMIIAALS